MTNGQQAGRRSPPHGLDLVIGFVNTIDREVDLDSIETPEQLGQWLRDRGLLPEQPLPVGRRQHRDAIELREALTALMLANNGRPPDFDAAAVVDRVAARGRLGIGFDADARANVVTRAPGFHGALSKLLVPVALASLDGTWARMKVCREPGCLEAFYDRSRNRSGIWCDMSVCGSRTKSRAYRRRLHTDRP